MLQVNADKNILPWLNLSIRWNDTRGDTVLTTRCIVDMICDGVSAFIGPEGSCHVEAIVAQSRNIPMISYVSCANPLFKLYSVGLYIYALILSLHISCTDYYYFHFQKCSDYKASMASTFARTEPPDIQVSFGSRAIMLKVEA